MNSTPKLPRLRLLLRRGARLALRSIYAAADVQDDTGEHYEPVREDGDPWRPNTDPPDVPTPSPPPGEGEGVTPPQGGANGVFLPFSQSGGEAAAALVRARARLGPPGPPPGETLDAQELAARIAGAAAPVLGASTVTDAAPSPVVGRDKAISWRSTDFSNTTMSTLPVGEDGAIMWDLAGPMMYRELPLVQFAVLYLTGCSVEQAQSAAKTIVNEWHGLKPDAGKIDGNIRPEDVAEGEA